MAQLVRIARAGKILRQVRLRLVSCVPYCVPNAVNALKPPFFGLSAQPVPEASTRILLKELLMSGNAVGVNAVSL